MPFSYFAHALWFVEVDGDVFPVYRELTAVNCWTLLEDASTPAVCRGYVLSRDSAHEVVRRYDEMAQHAERRPAW